MHMRAKIENSKKAKTKGISLFPADMKYLAKRANELKVSESKVFQALLGYDRAKNILRDALVLAIDQNNKAV